MKPAQNGRTQPARKLALILDLGDGPDPGEAAIPPRHQKHEAVALASGLQRGGRLVVIESQRHDHMREHNPLAQGKQRKNL
jgi:hypothetical protein